MTFEIHEGDVLEVLPTLEAESFDAVLCDPPYGLGFMGKAWDSPGKSFVERKPVRSNAWDHVGGNHNPTGPKDRQRTQAKENAGLQAWVEAWAREVSRLLRPGAHVLAFGGTRTFHRLAVGIEDAGFEIRDCLSWLYGSGFPKSLDVSKAIDKAGGHERERVPGGVGSSNTVSLGRFRPGEAMPWSGYGTALKPAWEPCLVAMKPTDGTFAQNALRHGVAGVNVDGGRIGVAPGDYDHHGNQSPPSSLGRWPANVILDEEAAARLDAEVGERPTGVCPRDAASMNGGDSGGPSRFFYCAKASRKEREAGLEGFEASRATDSDKWAAKDRRSGTDRQPTEWKAPPVRNHHPTVKPLALCEYLARLILPPDTGRPRRLLVPFSGSGSEMIGALLAGWDHAVGIELEPEYARIARARIQHHLAQRTQAEMF